MHVVLQVQNAGVRDRQMVLRAGQVLRVGRTEWADLCVQDDPALADVHFSIECDGTTCRVRDLGSGQETLLNDNAITDAIADNGDTILAGGTRFRVEIVGGTDAPTGAADEAAADDSEAIAAAGSGFAHVAAATAQEVCQFVDLNNESLVLLTKIINPRDFIDRLVEHELNSDAIRFLAHTLPKQEAVWWAARCCDDVLAEHRPTDAAALEAARQWVADASEEHRQAAGAAADATQMATAAGLTAESAFWSGGSINPPDMPAAPPDEWMTARGVASAIVLAAVEDETKDPLELFTAFVRYGLAVADGEDRWPEEAG